MKTKAFLLVSLILAISIQAQGVIYVPANYANLQDAVDAATGTETIIVSDGTYTGTKNRDITIDKEGINLTIQSANGKEVCIIDAQGLERVFGLLNVNGADSVTIRGFTIKNGNDTGLYGGGGIYNHNSILTVEDCNIVNCTSNKGGAIYNGGMAGGLTMDNCLLADNYTLVGSSGGAVYVGANYFTATNCVFRNNSVQSPGMHGGCMYAYQGDVTLINCVIEGSSADGSGGVFYNANGDFDLINCTFVGNTCTANGGVGFISGTSAFPATVDVRNCIFRDNNADGTDDVFRVIGSYAGDAILTYSYCDVDTAEISNYGGTINNLGGNVNVDSLFYDTGYWNSGNWIAGDYHLKSMVGRWDPDTSNWALDAEHSPCIDIGDPADSFASEPVPNGGRINMGAYGNTAQASKSPYCQGVLLADINHDCHVNFLDFAQMALEWLECDMIPQSMCW
ncbi:MAG: hypothetical protein JW806_03765 [Sedimentisphaerales bacterium]|nr:hypothetical protein [Sedimentisphaerales bacterium]